MESFHVALTGHRPSKLAGYDLSSDYYTRMRAHLLDIIIRGLAVHPHLTLHSGMALGADTVWAQSILQAREIHGDKVTFWAEIPTISQARPWINPEDKRRWATLRAAADGETVYASIYTPQVMNQRNRGMVAASQLLLAIHDGSSGGTANAIADAAKLKVKTHIIHPDTFR